MSNGRPYSVLGAALDRMARDRHVRGPRAIARHVEEKTGEGPGYSAWSQTLYGDTSPREYNLQLFAEAFDLTHDERVEVALKHLFRGSVGRGIAA